MTRFVAFSARVRLRSNARRAGVPLDPTNLIWRAAETLWRSLRRSGPVRDIVVQLDKQIPLQAGLGGGSADAAAALMALAHALARAGEAVTAHRRRRAHRLRRPLLSVRRHRARAWTRRGNLSARGLASALDRPADSRIRRVDERGVRLVRFASAELSRAPREPQHVPGPWPSRAAQMINDLEAPIARHHPEIDQMKAALRRVGALAASMSGSGSTVFGLFQKRRDAVAAVERLKGSGWRVLLTESLAGAICPPRETTNNSRQ